jgi:hypothetical protein
MKLASKVGVKESLDDRIKHYYVVPSTYDFAGNGAVDVSSLQNIWDFKHHNPSVDYKMFRDLLKVQVASEGFSNIGPFWQKVAATHFCVSSEDIDSVLTTEERLAAGEEFHRQSIAARSARFQKASTLVYNSLSKADAQEIVYEITQFNLAYNYIQFGIEGTEQGDIDGLFDYLNSTGVFSGMGLRDKRFSTTNGLTLAQLADKCLNILKGLA